MEKENLTLKINEVNINGEGVAYINNEETKVCVKGVLPEETVIAKKVFEKKNFINAKLEKVVEGSSLRIKPKCNFCGNCGGCDYQHISVENGLELKRKIISKYFADIYSGEIIANKSKSEFNYRNKVSFFVKGNKIGFQQENTNNIVEIDNCMLLQPILNRLLIFFKKWLKNNKEDAINHLVARVLNENLIITLVVREKPKNLQNLVDGLKKEFLNTKIGFYLNYNTSSKFILSDKWEHIFGLKNLQDNFNGVDYFVHPYSFLQVNNDVRNDIYNIVLQNVDNREVIEGYSGAGLLSAIIAKKAKKVFAVEINKNATKDADYLKKINNLTNLQNINGDCSKILPELAKQNPNAIFLIDPPRSGCDQNTLKAIKENNISKVIYISCNPYTLKQNLKFLSDNYNIDSIQIFDMFPNTSNIESLAFLTKK